MKFSGKMWLMIILKFTKNQGLTLSLEDTLSDKPQGGQIDPPSRLRDSGIKFSDRILYIATLVLINTVFINN